jgi:hypothetical protein
VDTLSSEDGTRRGLRDRPLGKIAILVALLLTALLVARSCGSSQPEVTQAEAVEIARDAIDFEPARVQVRNVPRSLQGHRSWAVSLYTGTPTAPGRCRLVEVDARSGRVVSIKRC